MFVFFDLTQPLCCFTLRNQQIYQLKQVRIIKSNSFVNTTGSWRGSGKSLDFLILFQSRKSKLLLAPLFQRLTFLKRQLPEFLFFLAYSGLAFDSQFPLSQQRVGGGGGITEGKEEKGRTRLDKDAQKVGRCLEKGGKR